MYTKLSVFDFDGTLVDTPVDTKENRQKWADYYDKEEWPYIGWWGRNETLDMDVWDMPLIDDVITDYKKEIGNPETMVIMLTGRLEKQRPYVEAIIDKYGLKFHKRLLKQGGNTINDKLRQLNEILSENPSIKQIEMWDDRDAHIPKFEDWGNNLEGIDFKINHVPGFQE
jgi:hypothetical protein